MNNAPSYENCCQLKIANCQLVFILFFSLEDGNHYEAKA